MKSEYKISVTRTSSLEQKKMQHENKNQLRIILRLIRLSIHLLVCLSVCVFGEEFVAGNTTGIQNTTGTQTPSIRLQNKRTGVHTEAGRGQEGGGGGGGGGVGRLRGWREGGQRCPVHLTLSHDGRCFATTPLHVRRPPLLPPQGALLFLLAVLSQHTPAQC